MFGYSHAHHEREDRGGRVQTQEPQKSAAAVVLKHARDDGSVHEQQRRRDEQELAQPVGIAVRGGARGCRVGAKDVERVQEEQREEEERRAHWPPTEELVEGPRDGAATSPHAHRAHTRALSEPAALDRFTVRQLGAVVNEPHVMLKVVEGQVRHRRRRRRICT
eukprot:450678-Pleurochrysis_carterae.AAC.2